MTHDHDRVLRTLIFHPHVLVRAGLKQVLAEEYRSVVFGEAHTTSQVLVQIRREPWDVVILDVDSTAPDKDRFYLLQETLRRRPSLRVCALSAGTDDDWVARALELGAAGCVRSNLSRSDLVRIFKHLAADRTRLDLFPPKMPPGSSQVVNPRATLSAREQKVLLAVATGMRTGEIATEWNLSAKTVSTYKRRVLDKLELKSTADLVRYVIRERLA